MKIPKHKGGSEKRLTIKELLENILLNAKKTTDFKELCHNLGYQLIVIMIQKN